MKLWCRFIAELGTEAWLELSFSEEALPGTYVWDYPVPRHPYQTIQRIFTLQTRRYRPAAGYDTWLWYEFYEDLDLYPKQTFSIRAWRERHKGLDRLHEQWRRR